MSEDMVEQVDENDSIVAEVTRTRAHSEGLPHRVAVVYLTRPSGEILVQQRMSGRFDHSAAGHVDPGETYEQAAYRELFEELGVNNVQLVEIGKTRRAEKRPEEGTHIDHVFTVFECQAEPGALAPREVKGVAWQDPHVVWGAMQRDREEELYTGGFKATLQLYMRVHNIQ